MAQQKKKKPVVTRTKRGKVIATGSGVGVHGSKPYAGSGMDPRNVDPLMPQSSKGALEKMYGTKRKRSGTQKRNIRKSDLY